MRIYLILNLIKTMVPLVREIKLPKETKQKIILFILKKYKLFMLLCRPH